LWRSLLQCLMVPNTHGSTTLIGDGFRDAVCALLRTQYPDASTETYINGTKVDIVFTRSDFGRRQRIAVECKNYDTPLTKTDIEREIYPKYQPLLEEREIDSVLVVSKKPINSPAGDYIRGWRHARHLTIQELEESLLGIRRYIEAIAELQPTDDAAYIEARFADMDGEALENVKAWVASPAASGLAILGSYGQGKTSLARRIAGYFAKSYLSDSTQRIPILKRLGDVVHETRLEGLLGAEFTADSPARGYQFKTFEHLNQSGRLLVILDGFDEMKHAMTASDFFSNFREFNRLLQGQSKVLLLGRPNALPSDAQDLVFRGVRKVGGQMVASTEFAQWKEWSLAFFDEVESCELLGKLLTNLTAKYEAAGRFSYQVGFVERRTDEVLQRVPGDLLARPVHVQLIAELAADPNFDFEGFNRYRLYDHFIRSMVERDTNQKRARKAISLNDRLQFQRDLAWWAWRRIGKGQGSFIRDEIPLSLLADLPDGNSTDSEGKLNEYIVSTLTEEKHSGVLYFAHRSFQEFLIAERLRLARPDPNAHSEYSAHLTPDIFSFLSQAPDLSYVLDWYDTLRAAQGMLWPPYIRFFATFPHLVSHVVRTELTRPAEVDLWTVMISVISSWRHVGGALGAARLHEFLHEVLRWGNADAAATAVLALVAALPDSPVGAAHTSLAAGLIERCLRRARPESDGTSISIESKQFDFAATWMANLLEKNMPRQGALDAMKLQFDRNKLLALCQAEINDRIPATMSIFSEEHPSRPSVAWSVEAAKTFQGIDPKLRKAHDGYLNQRRIKFSVVAYDKARKGYVKLEPKPRSGHAA